MGRLQDVLLDKGKRDSVIDDCVTLIDNEVSAKGGLTGLAVKASYGVVKKVKPGIIREAVDRLLDEFVAQVEPFYEDFAKSGGKDLSGFLTGRSHQVADSLLKITDARASRADNRAIKKAYETLRPQGAKHVEAAVPGISRLLQKHV